MSKLFKSLIRKEYTILQCQQMKPGKKGISTSYGVVSVLSFITGKDTVRLHQVIARNHFDTLSKYLHLNNMNEVPEKIPHMINYLKCSMLLIVLFSAV